MVAALATGAVIALVPVTPLTSAAPAQAAVASQFNPGFIVTDQNFYDGNAMSIADVQNFLNSKVSSCAAGYVCLKNYVDTTRTVPATPMCSQYNGGVPESAATIIVKVAQACGVSPKTILVTLQKEEGLVTSTAPSAGRYRIAMGYACPDTAACDSQYYGFFNQVFAAAYQFKRYTMPPGTGAGTIYDTRWDLSYPVGKVSAVYWSPNHACGASNVFIQNQATHALYLYTPYTPNAAALANLYGTGDGCSSYGNRNFWVYWSDWFGSPTNNNSPYGEITATTPKQNAIGVHGWAVDPDTGANSDVSLSVRLYVDGADAGLYVADKTDAALAQRYAYYGTKHVFDVTLSGVSPGIHSICARAVNIGAGANNTFACTTSVSQFCGTNPVCPSAQRTADDNRFSQAVAISRAAFPTGAPVVYIASGLNYPDALSAAPLAARAGGPLLLSASTFLPPETSAEISRLHPSSIVIVGGPNSVNAAVESSLNAIAPTTRITGADRYEVSRNVASKFGTSIPDLYIATGDNFPDALSADSVGSYLGRPVILVPGGAATLDPATEQFIRTHGVQRVTIVGGPVSVTPGIQTALNAIVPTTRATGSDRFEASEAANHAVFTNASQIYLATGLNFPDALGGAVLAAKKGRRCSWSRPTASRHPSRRTSCRCTRPPSRCSAA
ncbi:hypothetical protein GCM10025881_10930 [Pseudolysinimonas kribbensis]|uniref:Cell wall-binding repeat-containing protein n=1 Tax=Pseudolysinimonas kribbensis TaxID=433641 RepID=A0ABQ6K493_9MICO|nr:cell wall-binding repeat-containing protein [Pseudolysinimonas kribbensis]GMA94269.1 hypothetical protein GCM10025881_10930 [Pseudolysinimonas kribbensis]